MRLADQLRKKMRSLDGKACAMVAAELEYIRKGRDLIAQLMALDTAGYERTIDLSAVDTGKLDLVSVSSLAMTAENRFAFQTASSRYDLFEECLIADDFANYLAAVRRRASEPTEYGSDDTWVAWWVEAGWVLCKAVFKGPVSALRSALPDALSRRILDLAGVDVSNLRNPVLIVREADFGRLQTQQ